MLHRCKKKHMHGPRNISLDFGTRANRSSTSLNTRQWYSETFHNKPHSRLRKGTLPDMAMRLRAQSATALQLNDSLQNRNPGSRLKNTFWMDFEKYQQKHMKYTKFVPNLSICSKIQIAELHGSTKWEVSKHYAWVPNSARLCVPPRSTRLYDIHTRLGWSPA